MDWKSMVLIKMRLKVAKHTPKPFQEGLGVCKVQFN